MGKHIGIAVLTTMLVVGDGNAQQASPKWIVGIGWGPTSVAEVSGSGFTGHLGMTVRNLSIFNEVRIAVTGGTANGDGSPFSCQQARQFYCLGRTDESIWGEVSMMPTFTLIDGDRMSFYIATGLGIFIRRTHSSEMEGPTGLCIINNELVSCPDNPPFQRFEKTDRVWGGGWTAGMGVAGAGALKWFAEIRAHEIWEGGDNRSAVLPIMVGVRF